MSGVLFVLALISLAVFGLKPGIDFTGGTLMQVSFSEGRPERIAVIEALQGQDLGSVSLQSAGDNGYLFKMKYLQEEEHQQVLSTLRQKFETDSNKVLEERLETIGPSISSDLTNRSIKVAIAIILAIVAYIAYSFRKVSKPVASWKYGVAAIVALVHDVVITMGIFALLGRFMNVEVDVPFVVAMLTVFGYSVNDTIVVFDRVRENLAKNGASDFDESVNAGLNDTLVRSLNTTCTTLLVLAALFFFGGDSIHYFSLALIIGIGLGAWSSIFVASPLLVAWNDITKRKATA